jgi:signal transduction histidine kinase
LFKSACFFCCFTCLGLNLFASAESDSTYLFYLYGHGLRLTEQKADSILYYSEYIGISAEKIHYAKGRIFSLRLKGFFYESKSEFEKAIDYYLQTLAEARRQGTVDYQISALTDLAAVYTSDLNRPEKAKEVYLECLELKKKMNDPSSLVSSYTNLSAIYNRLGLYDSSLILLKEGLRLGLPLEASGQEDLGSLYNNMGNTYFLKKEYKKALPYFEKNYKSHRLTNNLDDLWLDELNLADTYSEIGQFDSASQFSQQTLDIARQLHSTSKESDSYSVMARLFQHEGDYKKAYESLKKWYELDTSLVNADSYKVIAELQEKFNARERENEKLLLQAEVAQQKFNNRIILMTAIGLLITGAFALIAFMIKRRANEKLKKTNDLVLQQNEKLAELNQEKNSLISIVSHDLSTPFASIGMWTQVFERESLHKDHQKALDKILQSTRDGEQMIRHILHVEREEANRLDTDLEVFELRRFTEDIMENFVALAGKKNIELILHAPETPVNLKSDKDLLARIFGNLISNAIKYSLQDKKIWVIIAEEKASISIRIKDQGQGIRKSEMSYLFAKYGKLSARPTRDEESTGLGLWIVKRIVEELQGRIYCESEWGSGTVFIVEFPKA